MDGDGEVGAHREIRGYTVTPGTPGWPSKGRRMERFVGWERT